MRKGAFHKFSGFTVSVILWSGWLQVIADAWVKDGSTVSRAFLRFVPSDGAGSLDEGVLLAD
jgi:hypothetical protein